MLVFNGTWWNEFVVNCSENQLVLLQFYCNGWLVGICLVSKTGLHRNRKTTFDAAV